MAVATLRPMVVTMVVTGTIVHAAELLLSFPLLKEESLSQILKELLSKPTGSGGSKCYRVWTAVDMEWHCLGHSWRKDLCPSYQLSAPRALASAAESPFPKA